VTTQFDLVYLLLYRWLEAILNRCAPADRIVGFNELWNARVGFVNTKTMEHTVTHGLDEVAEMGTEHALLETHGALGPFKQVWVPYCLDLQ
jgi:hypothetical protein